MEVNELIKKLEQEGRIQKSNLTYMPENMDVKKIIIWRNPTPVCPRWDAEIWYGKGNNERLTSISKDTLTLLFEIIKLDERW